MIFIRLHGSRRINVKRLSPVLVVERVVRKPSFFSPDVGSVEEVYEFESTVRQADKALYAFQEWCKLLAPTYPQLGPSSTRASRKAGQQEDGAALKATMQTMERNVSREVFVHSQVKLPISQDYNRCSKPAYITATRMLAGREYTALAQTTMHKRPCRRAALQRQYTSQKPSVTVLRPVEPTFLRREWQQASTSKRDRVAWVKGIGKLVAVCPTSDAKTVFVEGYKWSLAITAPSKGRSFTRMLLGHDSAGQPKPSRNKIDGILTTYEAVSVRLDEIACVLAVRSFKWRTNMKQSADASIAKRLGGRKFDEFRTDKNGNDNPSTNAFNAWKAELEPAMSFYRRIYIMQAKVRRYDFHVRDSAAVTKGSSNLAGRSAVLGFLQAKDPTWRTGGWKTCLPCTNKKGKQSVDSENKFTKACGSKGLINSMNPDYRAGGSVHGLLNTWRMVPRTGVTIWGRKKTGVSSKSQMRRRLRTKKVIHTKSRVKMGCSALGALPTVSRVSPPTRIKQGRDKLPGTAMKQEIPMRGGGEGVDMILSKKGTHPKGPLANLAGSNRVRGKQTIQPDGSAPDDRNCSDLNNHEAPHN
ncbi:hypothetical protein BDN72DRAFT_862244 [Pluteus cervinus]|uniref:Uncharacterized protein n=1 Tax=Pluteus cervinus TaxID=181527 RepID=A0ACD3ABJ9_9AGAR|nr:hypothetical protein BDN72DRAFT_862244 [Pluteus cervinus]